ncbi:MAG: hypothetical protein AUG75_17305 [Cyanobacteria bacterium 13_1_20CM_4_61_6]|nr:MAG: hypothetical protein AUG75_17305 [Cyanobacteria bacterium 13_1_20CM_4_61_6]
MDEAETECRLALVENPSYPWALLAAASSIQVGSNSEHGKEKIELAKRAVALAPNSAEAHAVLAQIYGYGPEVYSELQQAGRLNPEELDVLPRLSTMLPSGQVMGGTALKPGEQIDPDSPDHETQRLFSIEPDFANAHVFFARRLSTYGRRERALAEYSEALRLEPDNAEIHFWLANESEGWNNRNLKLTELREAVRLSPDSFSYRESLVLCLESQRQFPEALEEARELVARHPRDWMASASLRQALDNQNDKVSSVAEIQRYIKAASVGLSEEQRVEAFYSDIVFLGGLLADIGQSEEAAKQFELVLHFHPDSFYVRNEYGNLLFDQKKYAEAAEQYSEAIRCDPEFPESHQNLADSFIKLNRLDAAISEYRQALELSPRESGARLGLARALSRKGLPEEAIAELKSGINENPDNARVHADLAYFLEEEKDVSSAVAEFRRALELDPNLRTAHNDLAWILATDPNLRNPAESLSHAEQAVKLLEMDPTPNSGSRAAFLDTLAEALLINSKPNEAWETEQKALASDPQNPQFRTRLERFRTAAANYSAHKK